MSVLVRSPSTTRDCFLKASRYIIGSLAFPLSPPWLYVDGFTYQPASEKNGHPIDRMLNLLCHPFVIVLGGAGIFNLLSIAYAFPPGLRNRLTQGRRALPWKPWVFGEGAFHSLYRYSCQHSHFRYLQQSLQTTFSGLRNALLPFT